MDGKNVLQAAAKVNFRLSVRLAEKLRLKILFVDLLR